MDVQSELAFIYLFFSFFLDPPGFLEVLEDLCALPQRFFFFIFFFHFGSFYFFSSLNHDFISPPARQHALTCFQVEKEEEEGSGWMDWGGVKNWRIFNPPPLPPTTPETVARQFRVVVLNYVAERRR